VKSTNGNTLHRRVLRINVGFLLSDGPGNSHDADLHIPDPIRIDDDLVFQHLHGDLRFSRMKEGILVQGKLAIGLSLQCSRCLDHFERDISVRVEELYAHPKPIGGSEFYIGQDGNLDLAPLLRAETLIQVAQKVLCSPDCKGLCPQCGTNLNQEQCDCEIDDIDPRLAKLRELLDTD